MDITTQGEYTPPKKSAWSIDAEAREEKFLYPQKEAELSIIVPTFNEGENVYELIRRLHKCLAGYAWEVLFVDDDSPDGTAELVREIGHHEARVRCLQRIGRRGLSSACIEGMLASSAPYAAIIDGDLQHDEKLLPHMLELLKGGRTDIVVGSRYSAGAGLGDLSQPRAALSRLATRLSRVVLWADITDPLSGFFMVRREAFSSSVNHLSGVGFKILLDLFASSPRPLRFKELPYQFRSRQAGESKLDGKAMWDFGKLLLNKLIDKLLSRFCCKN